MRKYIFLLTFLFFFLNITLSNAQKSLTVSFAQGTPVASSTTAGIWNTVAQTTIGLTDGEKVLVEAIIEVEVIGGNSDINTQFRLTDGTTFSQTIDRYVATKTYVDKGIVAISFIFDYGTGFTGSKTFALQQSKTTTGASKFFTSKAIITAIEIAASSNVILPIGQGTTASISTSSASYSAATTTNIVTLEKPSDIYIVSTFSTSTSDASATGAWSLRESTDNVIFTDIPNSQITRSIIAANANGIGAATIVTLIKNKPAGNYFFRLGHKVNSGTNIITSGATISAVVLRGTVATGDNVFPSYTDSPDALSTTSNTFEIINSATITSPTNTLADNIFFMHTNFNMGAPSGNVVYASYTFGSTGGIFTPFEIQRYILDTKTGSGGLIGMVSGINQGDSFTASFQHRNSGGVTTLNTSSINTIGFFLNSDPNSTLSVEEDILISNISIYPNPTQEIFYISNNVANGETSFNFYTVNGQLVYTINLLPKTNTKIDITDWTSGTYIMKATNNGINIAKKLIIE